MSTAWTFAGESASTNAPSGGPAGPGTGGGPVTLVDESSFCLSGRGGDIHSGTVQGLFVLDTRLICSLELTVDGISPEPLAVSVDEPFAATFVARVRLKERPKGEDPLLVIRRRYVGSGLRDDLTLRNYNRQAVRVRVHVDLDGDFADLFAVKEGRAHERLSTRRVRGSRLEFEQVGAPAAIVTRDESPGSNNRSEPRSSSERLTVRSSAASFVFSSGTLLRQASIRWKAGDCATGSPQR